ncbi:hypothetical protein [Sphingobacterium sp. BN32]|uniref:hypothetical protein n=1 Tax=Sphingobacterium sp. BN32 TaxID=3058432 RepID=UPI00265CBFFA|nr:hypothetical protein [Sphingobacterium sp. BN32]WKK56991.1 hypothetical protein QYC40_10055 [Sphingobacterium sp. BN32]
MQKISQHIAIRNNRVLWNDNVFFEGQQTDFKDFAKELYQRLGINYPKFYKMDNLCKLAFLASEIALKDIQEKDIALIFSNKEGSLDSDMQHQKLISDVDSFYPSPAVFVYTLPNISIGEVSIRHQLKSESMFLLADSYQSDYIAPYCELLINSGKAKKVLCGWLKMINGDYQANFYLVELEGILEHNIENIDQIINK